MASGMGGIRTSGDLVARMQMTRGMKIREAKKFVAGKLGVSGDELTDDALMREAREDLRLGGIYQLEGQPKGIEVKHHIAEFLGIGINSVTFFQKRST